MCAGSSKGSGTESTKEATDFGLQQPKTKGICKEGDAVVALHLIGTSFVIKIVIVLGSRDTHGFFRCSLIVIL